MTAVSGGIGAQYAVLAPALAERGHDVHVITLGGDGSIEPRAGLLLHRHPEELVRPVRTRWQAAAGRTLRSLGRFDVVMAPEWGADAWAYARDKRSGPLVSNLQSSTAQLLKIATRLPPWTPLLPSVVAPRLAERDQVRRSDAVLACSQAVLSWAEELWPLRRVPRAVLPNAIDAARVRELGRGEPPPLADGRPLVVFSGRLEERKAPHVLVAAMRSVWQRQPDASVAFVGRDQPFAGGPMSDHLRALAGAHRGKLQFLGDQPPERLFPVVAAADVVALPSLWEAFGIVALEAMALARPLVVSSGSGFSEFVRDGRDGLLSPPGDPAALATVLLRLTGDRALAARIGASAAERADEFTVDRVAARLEQLCDELL